MYPWLLLLLKYKDLHEVVGQIEPCELRVVYRLSLEGRKEGGEQSIETSAAKTYNHFRLS